MPGHKGHNGGCCPHKMKAFTSSNPLIRGIKGDGREMRYTRMVQKAEEAHCRFDNKLEPMPGVCFQGCTRVHMNTHDGTWMHSQKG